MNNAAAGVGVGVGVGWRSPLFTAAQWEELEQQALVYKYLASGVPVPPELHLAIRRSYEARYYHQAALGYCSYYGKKLDPEPGRCRRTDGKKWRCSKDAYPGSKYCERHMHRGRNRSRKPVEAQSLSNSQSSSTSSTVTSLTPSGSIGGTGSGGLSFHSNPLHSMAGSSSSGNPPAVHAGAGSSQLPMNSGTDGLGNKDFRYLHGVKPKVDEHSFFSEASGSARALGMDSTLDSAWRLMPSQPSSFPPSRDGNGSFFPSNYTQLQPLQDLGQASMSSLPRQQEHHSIFESEFNSSEPVKQDNQSLRPFFDEWPKTRDSWSDLEDERSNRTSYSTTQLSISIPMAPSDFSTTCSRSPNDD